MGLEHPSALNILTFSHDGKAVCHLTAPTISMKQSRTSNRSNAFIFLSIFLNLLRGAHFSGRVTRAMDSASSMAVAAAAAAAEVMTCARACAPPTPIW